MGSDDVGRGMAAKRTVPPRFVPGSAVWVPGVGAAKRNETSLIGVKGGGATTPRLLGQPPKRTGSACVRRWQYHEPSSLPFLRQGSGTGRGFGFGQSSLRGPR